MKVYIAASMNALSSVLLYAEELERSNIQCTSRWRFEEPGVQRGSPEYIGFATKDMEDIERSDFVIVLNDVPSSTGGLHTELGYALALRKNIIVVGERRSPFDFVPQHAATWENALRLLSKEETVA